MSEKMTLEETWKQCMSMWRWIADRVRAGDNRSIDVLKAAWIEKHDFINIKHDCFFCHYCNELCEGCPGVKIDMCFNCCDDGYHFRKEPIKFYNKLRRLYRLYQKQPK